MKNIAYTGNRKENQYISAIMGFVVGDALGVPVEFMTREELQKNPVIDMVGYGTHNQPAGTWSDDTSMVAATMEWLGDSVELPPNYTLLMEKFSEWLIHGEYTPYGETFDCGIATSRAIMNYGKGMDPLSCGGKSEYDNGNGSLMRILPAALCYSAGLAFENINYVDYIYELSSLTHAHTRSKIGCFIYSKIIADMMYMIDDDKFTVLEKSIGLSKNYLEQITDCETLNEKENYHRLWNLKDFARLSEREIKSSGYVVDTLEAAIWCFLNTDNYKECVLKAVNLGEDTDTVGAIVGGLAGLYYGFESIPEDWIKIIPRKDWIMELAKRQSIIRI